MIIEFLQPHALNLEEDFEFISTFQSKTNTNVEDYRLLLKGVNSGKEMLLGMHERSGPEHPHFVLFNIDTFTYKSPINIRQQQYSYYFLDSNYIRAHDFFSLWKQSDPMIHLGNHRHSFISKIPNYQGSYRLNNITY